MGTMQDSGSNSQEPEKNVPPGVWAFWLAVITCASVYFFSETKYTYIQTVVLALTLVVVAIYTHQTWLMQKAISLQTRYSILPIFIPEIVRGSQPEIGDWLELLNIGNGVALNIQIDPIDIKLDFEAPRILPAPNIEFEHVTYSPPQGRAIVRHSSYLSKEEDREPMNRSLDWLWELTPYRMRAASYTIKVRFRDVFGNKYVQAIHLTKSGCWPGPVEEDK